MPGDEVRWPGRKPPPALPKRQARIRWKTCGDVRTGACECACAGGREQPREAWAVLQADPYWNGQASGFSSEAIRDRREGSGMRRLARSPVLFAAMLSFGFLAAGCGHSGGAAIASLSPSRSVSVPSVSVPSRSASFSPGVSFSPTATASRRARARPRRPRRPSSSSSPAAGGGSGSALIWLWIGIGAVVLIGIIVLVARSAGRRSAAAASWRSKSSTLTRRARLSTTP